MYEKKEKPLCVDTLLDSIDPDDMTSLLKNWEIINNNMKRLQEMNEAVKDKIKIFLKERSWNRYADKKTKINVTLLNQKITSVNIKQLNLLLTPYQLQMVTKVTEFEKLIISTEEMRQKVQKHLKTKKISP